VASVNLDHGRQGKKQGPLGECFLVPLKKVREIGRKGGDESRTSETDFILQKTKPPNTHLHNRHNEHIADRNLRPTVPAADEGEIPVGRNSILGGKAHREKQHTEEERNLRRRAGEGKGIKTKKKEKKLACRAMPFSKRRVGMGLCGDELRLLKISELIPCRNKETKGGQRTKVVTEKVSAS